MSELNKLLKTLEEKADAATPGPWIENYIFHDPEEKIDWSNLNGPTTRGHFMKTEDAKLIAALNPDIIKKLIAAIKLQKQLLESFADNLYEPEFISMLSVETLNDCENILRGEENERTR